MLKGVLRVFLTVALAVSCTGYFLAEKQVTVTDGTEVRRAKTFAPSVGAALKRLGMKVGPDDRVLPSADADLKAEPKIEVRRAKEVLVVLNGARQRKKVTGRTVAEVLSELSVPQSGALVEPAPASSISKGDQIVVAQPVAASVEHDGAAQQVVTNVLTAGALLRQLGIALGPQDRVEPSIVAAPAEGVPIKVIRVTEVTEKVESKVAFKRLTESSDDLELGLRKIKTEGTEGIRAKSYRIHYEDGKAKSRVFAGTEMVREPTDELTLVGTKRPVVKSTTQANSGKASWFSASGLTAAHRSLPFGTNIRVTNVANGKQITVTVRDRGPTSPDRVIDLSDTAFKELAPLGRGIIEVKIEW